MVAARDRWAGLVRRWRRSGQTAREFAERAGLNAGTLAYWAWRLNRERPAAREPKRVHRARAAAKDPGFVELIVDERESGGFLLELGDGRRLRIPMQFDADALKRLLAMLREKSGSVVEAFFDWCDRHQAYALEQSPLEIAIRYATNQREALSRFVSDARLPMHNNVSERELRREAVSRKNWIFVGSPEGARANTTFVSLLASCAMHKLEPWAYLRDLFCLLPNWPAHRVLELAPVNWTATLQGSQVQQQLETNIFRRATLPPAPEHAAA